MNLRSNTQRRHSQQTSSLRSTGRSSRSRQMDDEPRSEENGRPKRNRTQVSYVPFFPPLDVDAERANAARFGRAFGRDSGAPSRSQTGYRAGGMAAKTMHMPGSSDDEGATPGSMRGSSARLDGLRSLPALSGIKSGLAPLNIGDLKRAQDKLISEALGVEGFADTEREARLVKASGGKDLADTDPLTGERTTFEMIGGLQEHIQTLKEMVVMPLMYPEIFANFKIKPPRGVLFYGPPGTGKTLMARALAGSCSTNQQRVAFFMRKGADVMSKWVGESERQLKLLFDQARAFQPSIIFFDEIDGLAPVRSSKQDQVHASIVSTLLALMDGLDSRGQVVVIGATNRIDAVDPALRRPGRFDREFFFPLPSEAARKQIIDIATQEWKPPLDEDLKLHLAKETRNYCGADVKALCTEAALNAVRRTYPQIYFSENKLLLDVGSIEVQTQDFSRALHAIVPNSNRTSVPRSQPIPSHIKPLLESNSKALQSALEQIVPTMKLLAKNLVNVSSQSRGNPEIKSGASSSSLTSSASGETNFEAQGASNTLLSYFKTFQPRILIAGEPGMGQKYLRPAALAQLENHKFHVTALDLASLHGDSTKNPEATVVQAFSEAHRHRLSVIYVPHADQWWMNTSEVAKSNFQHLLAMEPRQQPVLLLATSETPVEDLSAEFRKVFLDEGLGVGSKEQGLVTLSLPNDLERRGFFEPLLAEARHPSIVADKSGTFAIDDAPTLVQKPADLPELPLAPPPPPQKLTPQELEAVRQTDDVLLAQLRKELRAIMSSLKGHRTMFGTPWFEQNYPEYFDVAQHALTLDVIDEKIDVHYLTPEEWYDDVKIMTDEIAHLFPRRLASKAHALRDEVFLTRNSFTDEFRYDCKMMSIRRREARKKEAEQRRKEAVQVDENNTMRSSRRLRGEERVVFEYNGDVPAMEDGERSLTISRSKERDQRRVPHQRRTRMQRAMEMKAH
ncbi:hypothetical protein BJ742DRAFT_199141 [Cladochytrium replicatum]|nr:hypothetical protein BJ742DRAFT_199141 [Cladochytrium replicatum]